MAIDQREHRLRMALDAISGPSTYIIIDCPPSLGLLTINALAAADEVLVPLQCEFYALEGLTHLLRTIKLVRERLNPKLKVGGIVLTMFDGRTSVPYRSGMKYNATFRAKYSKQLSHGT